MNRPFFVERLAPAMLHGRMSSAAENPTPSLPILIDARGHRCPVPTLRLRRALSRLPAGLEIELLADDPLARIDVPHFARQAGHTLLSTEVEDAAVRFLIRKGG